MVKPSLPFFALLEAVTVRVEGMALVPLTETGLGEKDALMPVRRPLTDRVTGALKLFEGNSEIAYVVEAPRGTDLVVGLTERVKVGAGGGLTTKSADALWLSRPLDVASVRVYVPTGVIDVVVTLKLPFAPGVTVAPVGTPVMEP